MNANETLSDCIVREVKEETGIDIQASEIASVFDFFDRKNNIHKVEVYFTTKIKSDVIPKNWKDADGPVKFVRFFSYEELKNMNNVAPGFLKNAMWLKDKPGKVYEGHEVK
ncbi:MAG: NUDIX hydrolase [Candidatus Symbiodolus clandestinus]